jgi:hypothetical protein
VQGAGTEGDGPRLLPARPGRSIDHELSMWSGRSIFTDALTLAGGRWPPASDYISGPAGRRVGGGTRPGPRSRRLDSRFVGCRPLAPGVPLVVWLINVAIATSTTHTTRARRDGGKSAPVQVIGCGSLRFRPATFGD